MARPTTLPTSPNGALGANGDPSPSCDPPRDAILQGDCLEVLPGIAAGSIDLTVFSPPYDGIRDYGNDWSFDHKALGSELSRITVDGGVCAVVIGIRTCSSSRGPMFMSCSPLGVETPTIRNG